MKANLLFKYGQSGWCRHGLVLTVDEGRGLYAADTYWRNGYPSGGVDLAELEANGTFIADLDEFRKSDRNEYHRYAEADRVWIPIGGASERYLVRTNAKPDATLAVQQIKCEIEHWQAQKRSAEWHISELENEMDTYLVMARPDPQERSQ